MTRPGRQWLLLGRFSRLLKFLSQLLSCFEAFTAHIEIGTSGEAMTVRYVGRFNSACNWVWNHLYASGAAGRD